MNWFVNSIYIYTFLHVKNLIKKISLIKLTNWFRLGNVAELGMLLGVVAKMPNKSCWFEWWTGDGCGFIVVLLLIVIGVLAGVAVKLSSSDPNKSSMFVFWVVVEVGFVEFRPKTALFLDKAGDGIGSSNGSNRFTGFAAGFDCAEVACVCCGSILWVIKSPKSLSAVSNKSFSIFC